MIMKISHALLCSVLLLAACGGGDTAAPPTPPTPPSPPTPATVAISAGDGQVAEPSTDVTTAPSVVVRSSSGAAVPNIVVTFFVDSGGGTITSPSATTDAAGVATPGSWRLGAREGPQVLVATVSGITPVRIRATSRVPAVTIGTGTLASGGGTITVTRSGLLSGTTLAIPSGALTGSATISLSLVSTAGLVLKRGMTTNAPGLVVTSSVGALKRPARIRIPTTTRPDANTVLLAYSAQTGQVTLLPHQLSDATGISAQLVALDASIVDLPANAPLSATPTGLRAGPASLFGGARTSLAASTAAEETPFTVIITQLPPEALTRDYDSGFQIQRDNWDFTNFAVAWLPFLLGASGGSRATEVLDMSSGMVATSLWYFKTQRGAQPLYKRFRLQADQPRSNKVGIRWAALSSQSVNGLRSEEIKDVANFYKDQTATEFAWTNLKLLRQAFYVGDDRPVPVLLFSQATVKEIESAAVVEPLTGIAMRVEGGEIVVYVPENSDAPYRLKVTEAGGLEPLRIISLAGDVLDVRAFLPVLARPLLDMPAVASNFGKVVAGTVGDAEGWPVPELHWEKAKLDEDNVFVGDPLLHYWECPACPDYGVDVPGTPATANKPQAFQMRKIVGGAMASLPERQARGATSWSADSVESDKDPTRTGHHILLPQFVDQKGLLAGWLDWRTVSYRKVSLRPSPASVTISKDTTITVTLGPSQPLPAGTTYSWILRTDTGRDSVTTTTPTHVRNLKGDEKGKLLIIAHEKDTKRALARDSITIDLPVAEPFWRIVTISDSDQLLDPEELTGESPLYTMIERIFAVPASGLIALENEAGGKSVVRLRVLTAATWTTMNCCPPTLTPLPGELRQTIGEMPATTYSVGPFFSAYNITQWSQSTTNLAAGTLTGSYIDGGLQSRKIKDLGTQLGPRDYIRIEATRNGTSMSGTISIVAWFQDEDTDEVDPRSEPTTFRLPFTAVRIR